MATSTNSANKAVVAVGAGRDGEVVGALEAGVGAGYQSLPHLSPPHAGGGDGCVALCGVVWCPSRLVGIHDKMH